MQEKLCGAQNRYYYRQSSLESNCTASGRGHATSRTSWNSGLSSNADTCHSFP